MQDHKTILLLIIIFVFTFSFRVYYAFSYDNFTSGQSYFNIYQTEKIKAEFIPPAYDELSYSGRDLSYPPLFHYILALTSFIPNNYKIIPALLFSLSTIIAFLIALKVSNNKWAALFAALLYSFMPSAVKQTLNSVSVYALAIPLIFLILYLIIISSEKSIFNIFILASVFLFFTHPSYLILTISLILYPILLKIVNIKINDGRKEAIIFFIILSLLATILIFRKDLSSMGFNAIFQNIPLQIQNNFFKSINPLEIVTGIGLVTIIFGLIGISHGLFKAKKSSIFLLSSVILSLFVLMVSKLIDFNIGLLILGLSLAILSSLGMVVFLVYISKTKVYYLKSLFLFIILALAILTSVFPSFTQASNMDVVSSNEMEAFYFIKDQTPPFSRISASPEEGHLINLMGRRNIMDTYYLNAPGTTERFDDLKTLYKTEASSIALHIIRRYGIDYILLTNHTKRFYNIRSLSFKDKCLTNVFKNEEAEIYVAQC